MSKDLNKVMIIGRMGRDPEIKYTQSGTAVSSFTLASTYSVKRNDKWEDETEWIRCVAWRRLAEVIGEYLQKGSRVYVEGRLQTRSWEDNDGNKRYVTEVIVNDLIMLDSREKENSKPAQKQQANNTPTEDDVPPF